MVIELGHAILKDKQMTILEVKEKHGQLFLKVDFVSLLVKIQHNFRKRFGFL